MRYAEDLRNIKEDSHANKLLEYNQIVRDEAFRNRIIQIWKIINKTVESKSIDGRIKSLKSLETKISSLLNKKMPLTWIRDIFAFRILLESNNNPEREVKKCYETMKKISMILNQQGFYPCENIETKERKPFDAKAHPDIFVPKSTGLDKSLIPCVKDYILRPKSNGYQSLHYTCQDYKTSRCLEVQIRTGDMHKHAESGIAAHSNYKKVTYNAEEWNLSQIKVQGFKYLGNGKYEDNIGLIDPIIIL